MTRVHSVKVDRPSERELEAWALRYDDWIGLRLSTANQDSLGRTYLIQLGAFRI